MAKARKAKPKPLHRRVKKHHIGIGVVVGILVWVSVAVFSVRPVKVLACSNGGLTVTSPAANSIVNGQVNLIASSTSAFAGSVVFYINGSPLGQASASNNNSQWSYSWNSVAYPNGTYQVMAGDTSGPYCSSPVPFNVQNGTATGQKLSVSLQPGSWSGDTNLSVPFSARAVVSSSSGGSTDVNASSQFSWSTSLGVISSGGGPNAMYYSGPNAGSGTITVVAVFDGMKATASAPVKVNSVSGSSTADGSSPSPSPSASAAPTASDTSDTSDTSGPRPVSQPLDPQVAECLVKAIGQARYQVIISGRSQPTQDERLKGAPCFEPIHVIPARLAPVAPEKVSQLPQTQPQLGVAAAKTENVTANGKTKQQLAISGKGVPGTTVYIYVFSEPLVLQTSVDSSGNWSYQLDNPLKPGHHQVYAVMQQAGGQFVRSLPLPISIAQAASSSDNPQGNSLQIQQDRAVEFSGYIFGALVVVIVALRALFLIRRRMKKLNGA